MSDDTKQDWVNTNDDMKTLLKYTALGCELQVIPIDDSHAEYILSSRRKGFVQLTDKCMYSLPCNALAIQAHTVKLLKAWGID